MDITLICVTEITLHYLNCVIDVIYYYIVKYRICNISPSEDYTISSRLQSY